VLCYTALQRIHYKLFFVKSYAPGNGWRPSPGATHDAGPAATGLLSWYHQSGPAANGSGPLSHS
jgi:hypothetical protein